MSLYLNSNRAVVDNWLLELASNLIGRGRANSNNYRSSGYGPIIALPLDGTYLDSLYFDASDDDSLDMPYGAPVGSSPQEMITALFQLLDLIAVSDEIIYDFALSKSWKEAGVLQPVSSILLPINIGKNRASLVGEELQFNEKYDTPRIIREGALYYLLLARTLGTFYWPSPGEQSFWRKPLIREFTQVSC